MTEWKSKVPYSSSPQSSIAALKNVHISIREIDELSSTPSHHTPSFAPNDHPYTLYLYLLGPSVGEPEGVGGGRGAELVNQPPYVVGCSDLVLFFSILPYGRLS